MILTYMNMCADYEHYLSQQILPPIERLCDPIEGTDRARLADCLGLDPNRYRIVTGGDSEEKAFGTLDSLLTDVQRYKDADPFLVRCRACQATLPFVSVTERQVREDVLYVPQMLIYLADSGLST